MRKLGEILLERGFTTVGELHTALEACHRHRSRLGTQLLRLGFVTEKQLLDALAEQAGRPPVPVEMLREIPADIRDILPLSIARRLLAVPFAKVQRHLQVAFNNPRDEAAIEEIQSITGMGVEPFVATEAALTVVLDQMDSEVSNRGAEVPEMGSELPADGWEYLWKPLLPGPEVLLALGELEDRDHGRKAIFATYPGLSPILDPNSVTGAGYLDEAGFERALARADSRDAVGTALLAYASRFLTRLAMFSVYKDTARGWLVSGLGPVLEDVQSFSIGLNVHSLLQDISLTGEYHQGPVPDGDGNAAIAACLGDPPPQTMVVFPVWLKDRVVAFLVGDIPAHDAVTVPVDELKMAADVAGVALEMMILRRKIGHGLTRTSHQGTK